MEDKNILIGNDEFKAWFIEEGEDKFYPIILKNFGDESYNFLRELEKTFYKEDNGEKLILLLSGPLGMLKIGGVRSKIDNLRCTALYTISQLGLKPDVFVLIKKEDKLKKRLLYMFETYNINPTKIVGPNENYLKKNKNNKRNPLDTRLRHEVFKRDGYKCLECGATNKDKTLHADHIIPVSQGGSDELNNLQTLCDDCNLAKSNKKWKTKV